MRVERTRRRHHAIELAIAASLLLEGLAGAQVHERDQSREKHDSVEDSVRHIHSPAQKAGIGDEKLKTRKGPTIGARARPGGVWRAHSFHADRALVNRARTHTGRAARRCRPALQLDGSIAVGDGVRNDGDRTGAVEGVDVYCDACGRGGHTSAFTDRNGFYVFSGDIDAGAGVLLSASGVTPLYVSKDGYRVVGAISTLPDGSGRRDVTITGNTTFDIQIERR